MQKYRDSEIKSFEFSDLKGSHVVAQSSFKDFDFKELNGESFKKDKVTEESLRDERSFEKKNNFKIDGAVRDSRGILRQEQSDFETRIQDEVTRRLEAAYQEAFNQGLEKGKEEGKAEAFEQYQNELNLKMDEFIQMVNTAKAQGEKLLEQNRHQVYEFVKRFSKWIILKEIDEKVYLEKLLEKLILELNARKNLIVKVGSANFEQMPEIIQMVETKVGQLSNIRIEVVSEIQHPGIILESENGLIDGSLEGVFLNIDKIFEQVLNHE